MTVDPHSSDDLSLIRELRQRVRQKIDELEDLPTLPAVVMRVLELASDDKVNIRDLKQVVITDPPLSAKVLRAANSAYYSRRVKATSIDQAIVTIGLNELVTLCTSIGVINAFDHWKENHLDRHNIWRHALTTAFLAKSLELRKSMDVGEGPDIFLCGLLHNIGWIIIDQYFEPELEAILQSADDVGEWNLSYEREVLGLDHAEIGAAFLERWGLPESVATVIEHHHDPKKAGEYAPQAALVGLAAFLSPVNFRLEAPLHEINELIPHRLHNADGPQAVAEMKERYAAHIKQATELTNRLMDWL